MISQVKRPRIESRHPEMLPELQGQVRPLMGEGRGSRGTVWQVQGAKGLANLRPRTGAPRGLVGVETSSDSKRGLGTCLAP